MHEFSLDSDLVMEVKATFLDKGEKQPLTGDYLVRLYDKDVFNDDFLGEAKPNDDGQVKIHILHESFSKFHEDDKPDFYFVVYKHKKEIFRSKVMDDVDVDIVKEFKMNEGLVIDLGTFLIDG